MKKEVLTIFLVFIFSITSSYAAWDELDWDYDYLATVLATDANSISYSDGAKGEFAPTGTSSAYEVIYDATLARYVLHVSTLGADTAYYIAENCDPGLIGSITPAFDSLPGYTVQIRVKLNSTDTVSGSACAFQFDEKNRNRFWYLNLQSDPDGSNQTVGLNGNTTGVSITPGWHTYRILAENSGVSLYIDGSTTPALTASYGTTAINAIRFGDFTLTADSDYELAQLSVYSVRALLSDPTPTPAGWANLDWDYHYDGLARPGDTAAIRYSDSQVGNFVLAGGPASGSNVLVYSSELGRNVYYASTLGRDGGFYFSEESDPNIALGTSKVPAFNSELGYTVQIKAKLNSTDSLSSPACMFPFEEKARARYWALNLQSDPDGTNQKVGLTGTATQVSISQGWHTYRIAAHKDGIHLYIDGSTTPVLSSTYSATPDDNLWRFGDLTTTADSDYEVAQISVYSGGAVIKDPSPSPAGWDDLAWDYDYQSTTFPTWAGSIDYSDGSKGEFGYAGSNNGYELVYDPNFGRTILHVNTIDANSAFYMAESCDPSLIGSITPAFDSLPGYTVQIRVKLNSTDTVSGSACAFQFDEKNRNRFWYLNLQSDPDGSNQTVGLNGDTTGVSITPGWHTYRILAENSGLSLYIDGSTTPALTASYTATAIDTFRFGDFTTTADSDYELARLSIYSVRALLTDPTPNPGVWANLDWDYHYDGLARPGDTAAIRYSDTTVDKFTAAGSPASGSNVLVYSSELGRDVYDMNTLGKNGGFYFYKTSDAPGNVTDFSSAKGYTAQVKAKLISTDELSGSASIFQFEEATTGVTRYWALNLQSDPDGSNQTVGLNSNTTNVVPISQGWHTYRVTAEDNGVTLYIDGSSIPALTGSYTGTSLDMIRFGDLTGGPDAHLELAQVSVYSGGAVVSDIDFLDGDINRDGFVDFNDIKDLSIDWLAGGDYDYIWDADVSPDSVAWYDKSVGAGTAPVESIVDMSGGNNVYDVNMPDATSRLWIDTVASAWDPTALENTIVFRMRIIQDSGTYYTFEALACHQDLVTAGQWDIRGFQFKADSIAEISDNFCSNCSNSVSFDCTQWTTYELSYDGSGSATLSYWDGSVWQTLLTSSTGRNFTASLGSFYRVGNSNGGGTGYGQYQLDYVYHDGPGCGVDLLADTNGDCQVDFYDFATIANDWLQ